MAIQTLSPALLDAAFISFDLLYQQAFESSPTYWDKVATLVPSNTAISRHPWLDMLPQLREWVGERQVSNMVAQVQEVANKLFELTVRVKRTDFEDDQIGLYNPMFSEIGRSARVWPDIQIWNKLRDLTSTVYDGQPFFSATHPIIAEDPTSSTQANLYTSSPLTADNFAAVRAGMMSLVARNLVPMAIVPSVLVVPPQLEKKALEILNGEMIGQQVTLTGPAYGAAPFTNVMRGSMELLVVPYLADAPTTWYMFCTNRGIKPMIFQERAAPEFAYLNRPEDTNVFMHDEFLFGVRSRGAAGFGPWFLAAKATA